jgi:vitamin B12 transporter
LRSTHFKGLFDYDMPGSFSAPTDVHQGRTQLDSHTLYWSGRLGPLWSSRLNYSQSNERNDTDTPGGYFFSTQAITRSRLVSWTNQWDLPAILLSAGLDNQAQSINTASNGVSGLSRERQAYAVFGGLLYKRAAHNLQFNLRRDDVENLSAKDTFYLGYGYDLSAQWKLIATQATAFNMPPLGYIFDPDYGNTNLRPEAATTQELGFQWVNGSHRLRSTWFSTRTKDLLLYDNDTRKFGNISRVKNQGLETSYSGRFHMTDLRASLSLQDPVNEATGLQLVRRAKTLASLSVSQSLGLLSLGGSVRYTSARPDIEGKPGLPSNTLLDLTARYSLSRDWTLYGRVENATDSRYQTAYGYNQLPRTTTLGLSWKMKH